MARRAEVALVIEFGEEALAKGFFVLQTDSLAVKTSLAKMTASFLAKEFYATVVGYDVTLTQRHA